MNSNSKKFNKMISFEYFSSNIRDATNVFKHRQKRSFKFQIYLEYQYLCSMTSKASIKVKSVILTVKIVEPTQILS